MDEILRLLRKEMGPGGGITLTAQQTEILFRWLGSIAKTMKAQDALVEQLRQGVRKFNPREDA